MKSIELPLSRNGTPVRAWLCTPEGAGPWPLAILCHGLPARRGASNEPGYSDLAQYLAAAGFAALTFNFEGCGLAGGILDLRAWVRDLDLILATARQLPDVEPTQIHLVGFSAGGAVAARALKQTGAAVASLLLLATPANLAEILPPEPAMLWGHFAELGCVPETRPDDLVDWYAGFSLATAADLAGLACPLGLVHGQADETVPIEHAARLLASAAEPKQLKILENAGHRLRLDERVPKLIVSWLENRWKA